MSARRPWLSPLIPVYAGVRALQQLLRRLRPRRSRQLQWPVLSVGSLSAGGAGKTPVVLALAGLLRQQGWRVDVLSRGYRRQGRPHRGQAGEQVQPELSDAARRFGDEPTLIAQRAGVSVWVGADRGGVGALAETSAGNTVQPLCPPASGRQAETPIPNAPAASAPTPNALIPGAPDSAVGKPSSHQPRRVHLLDDGFQHQRLARTMDVVVVTAEDLQDALLPAGNLREPLTALARADVVVVREDEIEAVARGVWAHMREGAQMWTVRRRLEFPGPLFVFGAGLRPVAFCAIARPEGFASMLADEGCGIIETVAFADHHRYTMGDMERIVAVASGLRGSGFVTTEKDAVKLTTPMRERLTRLGPLMVVALETQFVDAQAVVRAIEARLS